MNNREKLIDMMHEHAMERRELAELVCVDRHTVDGWLAPPESSRHQEVPELRGAVVADLHVFLLTLMAMDRRFCAAMSPSWLMKLQRSTIMP